MDADRLLVLIALVKIIALEHPRDACVRADMHQLLGRHGAHPPAVKFDLGAVAVENLEDLPFVRLGVLENILLVNALRVSETPVGSPIMPVKSPIKKMTSWPRSWKCLSLWMSTVWPRCKSGAVGSKPALMRSGRFCLIAPASFSSSSFVWMISTAPRAMISSWRSTSVMASPS